MRIGLDKGIVSKHQWSQPNSASSRSEGKYTV